MDSRGWEVYCKCSGICNTCEVSKGPVILGMSRYTFYREVLMVAPFVANQRRKILSGPLNIKGNIHSFYMCCSDLVTWWPGNPNAVSFILFCYFFIVSFPFPFTLPHPLPPLCPAIITTLLALSVSSFLFFSFFARSLRTPRAVSLLSMSPSLACLLVQFVH